MKKMLMKYQNEYTAEHRPLRITRLLMDCYRITITTLYDDGLLLDYMMAVVNTYSYISSLQNN